MKRKTACALALVGAAILFAPVRVPLPAAAPRSQIEAGSEFVERAPDQSIRDIFGVQAFISRDEWQRVKDRVLRGEIAFIEPAPGRQDAIFVEREPPSRYAPILVRVVDAQVEPGTTRLAKRGLWLADHHADGTIDRAIDYEGTAAGSPAQRQTVIYYAAMAYGQPGLIVTTTDIATTHFQYNQDLDQWRSQFRGNAYLVFGRKPKLSLCVPMAARVVLEVLSTRRLA
ncbi:MAG: hypothetical protein FJY92_12450 [Candidatus Hydrogenedentes bacterium]|nr:hypothetical protein [Candidatus Hydrogenedentota bacterium]